jgi:hypothetical protein
VPTYVRSRGRPKEKFVGPYEGPFRISRVIAPSINKVSNLEGKVQGVFLCFVDRASGYNCVKKTQLDAQLILSILHQPLRVSGVSKPIIRRYDRMYTTIGNYYSL